MFLPREGITRYRKSRLEELLFRDKNLRGTLGVIELVKEPEKQEAVDVEDLKLLLDWKTDKKTE